MISALLLLLASPGALAAPERKLALLVSNNEGFDGTVALRYVAEDVRKTREVLERQGGLRRLDIYEVDRASPAFLELKIRELGYRIHSLQERGVPVSLFVYYSGHADADQIQLGRRGVAWSQLKAWLEAAGADTNLLVVDACGSGGLFAAKGLERVEGALPELAAGLADDDFAIITSSARDQYARESRELQSSLFTHFYTHGQWGDADADADGLVTLGESFRYASGWVDRWTTANGIGRQDPQLQTRDEGLVVADLAAGTEATVTLAPRTAGEYRVYEAQTGALVLPVEVRAGPATLALGPGRYVVHRQAAWGAARATFSLSAGDSVTLRDDDFELGWEDDIVKGHVSGARLRTPVVDVSVHAVGGVQTWLDRDVREGYFPTGGAAGSELRMTWPVGLYWSADVWGAMGTGLANAAGPDGWEAQTWRTRHTRSAGFGLGAGAMTHGQIFRAGGGLHLEGYTLDRRLSDGAWTARDGDPSTSPLAIVAPGLGAFAGIRDGHAEVELHVRTHYFPYSIEPDGGARHNVGSTTALLSLGWRL